MRLAQKSVFAIPLIALALLSSCKKADKEETIVEEEGTVDFKQMPVPDNFSYSTTNQQSLDVEVLLLGKIPYEGARFEVYLDDPTAGLDDPAALESLRMIQSFRLNSKGQYLSEIKLPSYVEKIYLLSKSIGIPEIFQLNRTTTGFKLRYDAGSATYPFKQTSLKGGVSIFQSGAAKTSARSWNNVGFPDYLSEPFYVSSRFLQRFQTAVPYKTPVNTSFLDNSIPRNIVLDLKPGQTADVSITFMFSTSQNKNTLGYYWYPTNTPPATKEDIVNKGYIFPSASRSTVTDYSGLVAGQTVRLLGPNADGTFPPNMTIGFFLISNGFVPSTDPAVPGTIRTTRTTYYSDKRFNNAGGTGNMTGRTERMVVLYDEATNKIVWAVEDGTDGDYSDIAFFASWNPNEAVPTKDYPKLPDVPRTDNDFVYYPGKNLKGTLMYEDCWPRLGDFDMNDMVLNHNYIGYKDENGNISDIIFNYDLKAISAQMNNSFGVMIPGIAPGNVQIVTNTTPEGINNNSNPSRSYEVEEGHTNDVVVKVFDGAATIMGGIVVNNTGDGAITRNAEKFSFTVRFKQPISIGTFNSISPFIIPNGKRNVETHLANRRPSVKINTAKYGTEDDNTSTGAGRYFLSNTRNSLGNLTWAVEVPSEIPYTKSGKSMTRAFPKFADWATSGGVLSPNWYTNESGNRATTLLVNP